MIPETIIFIMLKFWYEYEVYLMRHIQLCDNWVAIFINIIIIVIYSCIYPLWAKTFKPLLPK